MRIDPDSIDEQAEHLSDEERRILTEVRDLIRSVDGDKTELLVVATNPDWKGIICMGATYGGTRLSKLTKAVKQAITVLF